MDSRERWQALQSRLAAARRLVDAGDRARALEEIDAALAIDPEFLAAHSLRDRILSLNDTAEAPPLPPSDVPATRRPIVATDGYARFEQRAKRRRVDRRVEAARRAIEHSRIREAEAALNEVIELDPSLPELASLTAAFDELRRASSVDRRPWIAAAMAVVLIFFGASSLHESVVPKRTPTPGATVTVQLVEVPLASVSTDSTELTVPGSTDRMRNLERVSEMQRPPYERLPDGGPSPAEPGSLAAHGPLEWSSAAATLSALPAPITVPPMPAWPSPSPAARGLLESSAAATKLNSLPTFVAVPPVPGWPSPSAAARGLLESSGAATKLTALPAPVTVPPMPPWPNLSPASHGLLELSAAATKLNSLPASVAVPPAPAWPSPSPAGRGLLESSAAATRLNSLPASIGVPPAPAWPSPSPAGRGLLDSSAAATKLNSLPASVAVPPAPAWPSPSPAGRGLLESSASAAKLTALPDPIAVPPAPAPRNPTRVVDSRSAAIPGPESSVGATKLNPLPAFVAVPPAPAPPSPSRAESRVPAAPGPESVATKLTTLPTAIAAPPAPAPPSPSRVEPRSSPRGPEASVAVKLPASPAPIALATGALTHSEPDTRRIQPSFQGPVIGNDELLVKQILQRYRTAYEGLDARSAQAVWPAVNQTALAKAFGDLESQSLTFDACDVQLRGEAATATCRGSARYVPRIGNREPRVESRVWNFTLHKLGPDWKIQAARAER